jgi:hypothetical protein
MAPGTRLTARGRQVPSDVGGGPPCAIGVVCDTVSFRTGPCTPHPTPGRAALGGWRRRGADAGWGAGEDSQQVLDVGGAAVYWDRDVEPTACATLPLAEVRRLFEDEWGTGAEGDSVASVVEEGEDMFFEAPSEAARPKHEWLLHPADVTVSGCVLPRDGVKFSGRVALRPVAVSLEVGQMWDMFHLGDWLAGCAQRRAYAHLRPPVPVGDDPRAWWRYAIGAAADQAKRSRWRLQWSDLRVLAGQRREYADLYKQGATAPPPDPCPPLPPAAPRTSGG